MSACVGRKTTTRVSWDLLPVYTGPADAAHPNPLQGSRRKPGPVPTTRRSFSGLNLTGALGCSVRAGSHRSGVEQWGRASPGDRRVTQQVVGREVSLRQSSGDARLRSWDVGFHPAPAEIRLTNHISALRLDAPWD